MRDLHPDFINIIKSAEISPVRLIELHFADEPRHYWDGIGDLLYAGNIYLGIGALGEVDPITDTSDTKATQINLTLNCFDKINDFSELRTLHYQGQPILIHYGLMSKDSNEMIAVEEGAFVGRMDGMTVKTSPSGSKIQLTAVNELAFLKKAWGRFQTDADHQADYPGDSSRRFIPAIQDLKIRI